MNTQRGEHPTRPCATINRPPTLMDILQPRQFPNNSKRAEATRTVLQPDIDAFEASMAGAMAQDGAAPEQASGGARQNLGWWKPRVGAAIAGERS